MLGEDVKNAQVKEVPYWRRPAERPTIGLGTRIYKDQLEKLKDCYDGSSAALIRFLLDKYFNGELPELVKEFHHYKINE